MSYVTVCRKLLISPNVDRMVINADISVDGEDLIFKLRGCHLNIKKEEGKVND